MHARMKSYISVPKSCGSIVEIECHSFNPDEQQSPDFVKEEPQFDLAAYHTTNDVIH